MSLFNPMKDNLQSPPAPQNKRILTPKGGGEPEQTDREL